MKRLTFIVQFRTESASVCKKSVRVSGGFKKDQVSGPVVTSALDLRHHDRSARHFPLLLHLPRALRARAKGPAGVGGVAAFFWLGLRLAGLQRCLAWLDRSPVAQRTSLSQPEAAALGVAVTGAANHILGPANCLTRSLLLRWLLRRFGTASDLRIGVRLEEGKLAAHAWVEKDGIPVNDSSEVVARYGAFDQPIAPEMFS